MNERVLLVGRNGMVSEFYLESGQDRDFVTIADASTEVKFGDVADVSEPLPIRKRIFKFHHLGMTKVPVYHEMSK